MKKLTALAMGALFVGVCGGATTNTTNENHKIIEGKDWVRVNLREGIREGSALDFSQIRGVEAPAGKYGRVVAKGQNFEFKNLPGVAQRFYGVNINGTAHAPTLEESRAFTKHIAQVGYNAIRFHHHDVDMVHGSADKKTLNPVFMKKFDGLVKACIDNGLYITTDLYVSRRGMTYRGLGIDMDGDVDTQEYKALIQVHEGAYQDFLHFARQFLNHVNSYTGKRFADEPAVSWLSLVNEGNLGNYNMKWFTKHECWRKAWAKWIGEKRKQDSQYKDITDEMPKDLARRDKRQVVAFIQFLRETEERFARRVTDFLRNEIKTDILTTNMNSWFYPAAFMTPKAECYDYVDDHFYVDHPKFLEKEWQLPTWRPNVNPVANSRMGSQNLCARRLLDKPFTISEYNYVGPGKYRSVSGMLCGSAGALQNWGGLWRFAWTHSIRGIRSSNHRMGGFDVSADPLMKATERASVCLYLRKDLEELKETCAILLPPKKLKALADEMPKIEVPWTWLSWYKKFGSVVADETPKDMETIGVYPDVMKLSDADVRKKFMPGANEGNMPVAGNGAVTIDAKKGAFVVNTPRTCGGFKERGVIETDMLRVDIGDVCATVWVSSLDEKPIDKTDRLLLTHLTDLQNTEIQYADKARTTLLDRGRLPHLMRVGTAKVSVKLKDANWKVYSLEMDGERRFEVPSKWRDGRFEFEAKVNADGGASYLYEIVCYGEQVKYVDEFNLAHMSAGRGKKVVAKASVNGTPMEMGSMRYKRGFGTCPESAVAFELDGNAISFEAIVGIDDSYEKDKRWAKYYRAGASFRVWVDGKVKYDSGVMAEKKAPKFMRVDLRGAREVVLETASGPQPYAFECANVNWADAKFTIKEGARIKELDESRYEQWGILTPKEKEEPLFNGADIWGVRQGKPIIFRVPVSGKKPLAFSAKNLPKGVTFDTTLGIIGGKAPLKEGDYDIEVTAKNDVGEATKTITLRVGKTICLTPPMGWNSWNIWAWNLTGDLAKRAAKALHDSGLGEYGYSYVNIDDFWQRCNGKNQRGRTDLAGVERDSLGKIQPNDSFKDMKGIADYIHSFGFKAGLYSSPGITTCGRCTGSYRFEKEDAESYAEWGFDYLKYDWCSYGAIFKAETGRETWDDFKKNPLPSDEPWSRPFRLMSKHLEAQNRDIVHAFCQYGRGRTELWGREAGGQLFRIWDDLKDTWTRILVGIEGDLPEADFHKYTGAGFWADPDMMLVGLQSSFGTTHPTYLTPNEQYSHVSLWMIFSSPILIGTDLEKLDAFTKSILANREVIAINQDRLGKVARRTVNREDLQVWTKELANGDIAVLVMNLYPLKRTVTFNFSDIGLKGEYHLRDVWRHKDLGVFKNTYTAELPGHAPMLLRMKP